MIPDYSIPIFRDGGLAGTICLLQEDVDKFSKRLISLELTYEIKGGKVVPVSFIMVPIPHTRRKR